MRKRSTSSPTAPPPPITSHSSWRNILSPTSRRRVWSNGSSTVPRNRRQYTRNVEDDVRQQRILGRRGAKYKTPYQFVISAVRAAGLPPGNVRPLLGAMDQLGMPLFGCLTPDGYKNTEDAWLSPDATTRRIRFATALVRGGPGAVDERISKRSSVRP